MSRYPLTRRDAILAVAVAAVVAAVYAPMCWNNFVDYDDAQYVYENEHVLGGPTPENLLWAFTTDYAANWHPLTWVSLQIDAGLWGNNAGGYHLTALLLHAANAALFYLVLRAMTGAWGPSLFAAALWGVHPLHVESVAWITERKDTLSTFFWLLTIGAYVRYTAAPSWLRFWPVVIAFALSLLAKPMGVTLPFVLLLLDVWPLGRLRSPHKLGNFVFEKSLLFLLMLLSCGATFYAQAFGGAVRGSHEIPPLDRLGGVAVAYAVYLGLTVWPPNLAVLYPLPTASRPLWQPLVAVGVLLAITALSIRLRRTAPYLLVGWLWYLGTLVPVIGLMQVGEQAYADRYTYIPHMGLFIALVWGAAALAGRLRLPRWLQRGAAVTILVACAILTEVQLTHWRNGRALWEHAVAVMPGEPTLWTNLAKSCNGSDDKKAAMECVERALELNPDEFEALRLKAYILRKSGQLKGGQREDLLPPKSR